MNADGGLRPEHVKHREIAVQQLVRVFVTQPAGHHRPVYAAEIGGVDQVVTGIQFGEARRLAIIAALYLISDDEHKVGSAVVCTEVHILRHSTAKFRKYHHDDIISALDP